MAVIIKRDYSKRIQLENRMRELNTKTISFGWWSDFYTDERREGIPVATIAYWNHEGAGNLPRRPFFSNMLKETFPMKSKLSPMARYKFSRALKNVICGDVGVESGLTQIAEFLKLRLEKNIQNYYIVGGENTRNSREWAAVKGHDKPLVWTGKMVKSIRYMVE